MNFLRPIAPAFISCVCGAESGIGGSSVKRSLLNRGLYNRFYSVVGRLQLNADPKLLSSEPVALWGKGGGRRNSSRVAAAHSVGTRNVIRADALLSALSAFLSLQRNSRTALRPFWLLITREGGREAQLFGNCCRLPPPRSCSCSHSPTCRSVARSARRPEQLVHIIFTYATKLLEERRLGKFYVVTRPTNDGGDD